MIAMSYQFAYPITRKLPGGREIEIAEYTGVAELAPNYGALAPHPKWRVLVLILSGYVKTPDERRSVKSKACHLDLLDPLHTEIVQWLHTTERPAVDEEWAEYTERAARERAMEAAE